MKPRNSSAIVLCAALVVVVIAPSPVRSQLVTRPQQTTVSQAPEQGTLSNSQAQAEGELQTGITLTRKGSFREAISHLRAAQGHVAYKYAADFDLALCYVGVGDFTQAIEILGSLRRGGHENADVNNLLAQAYIGNLQSTNAFDAFKRAVGFTPLNEKLYLLVVDACMDRRNYALGLKVVDLGLQNLPRSGRLHYERSVLLSLLDQFDLAKSDFKLAAELAPESETAYMAVAQEHMFAGDMPEAIQVAREAIKKGHENPVLLWILGEALIRSGVSPGQPELVEAQMALEKSLAQGPGSSSTQIALAKVYVLLNRLDDAILFLEKVRQLDRGNPAVYANLATAYRRRGEVLEANRMLAILAELNQKQVEKIASAPGDRKASYGASRWEPQTEQPPK
jgi:tetratricopeptide (TPR) repeat protein